MNRRIKKKRDRHEGEHQKNQHQPDGKVPIRETEEISAERMPNEPGEQSVTTDSQSIQKELAETKDSLLRARAELQNTRRRFDNERSELVRYGHAGLVKSLLGTLDDLERVLGHGTKDENDPIIQGVRLVYDNFKKTLAQHRIETIDALGAPFDPRFHEALQQRPVQDQPPGTVVEVFRPGYRLDDRVLRPAQVIVAAQAGDDQDEVDSEADVQSSGVSGKE